MKKYVELEAVFQAAKRYIATHIEGIVRNHECLAYETVNAIEFARGYEQGAMDIATAITNLPTADVVEVVRCVECYKRYKSWCPLYGGHMGSDMDDDFYCKFGKRRETDVSN